MNLSRILLVAAVALSANFARADDTKEFLDPKNWEGEWKMTKFWRRVDDQDITEASCLPDLNAHMPSVTGSQNVR